MSKFYQDAAKKVETAFRHKGMEVKIIRQAEGKADFVTGKVAQGEPQTLICSGILKDYSSHLVDGTMIQAGDMELLIDPTHEPKTGDSVSVGGEVWRMVSRKKVAPGGIALLYKLQVRR